MLLAALAIQLIRGAIASLDILGSDTGTEKKLHLFKNDITPNSVESAVGDFVEADFGSYAAKSLADELGNEGTDPLSGEQLVQLDGPAASVWTTSDLSELPQTIYGYYVTDSAGTDLLAFERFETPIELNDAGQIVDVPDLAVRFSPDAFA